MMMTTIEARAFKNKRAIAMSITTCGAPTGGVIYTLAFQQLISRTSFGWTVRVMAFIMLGTYCLTFPFILLGGSNLGDIALGTGRKLFDRSALKNLPFWCYSTSSFVIFGGYLIPFIFVPSYGQRVLGLSPSKSLNISMIMQATSIIGRLIAGYTASRIGVLIPWITCVGGSGALCFAWIAAKSESSFIAVTALYGCISGALIALPPSVSPFVCPDAKVFGTRLGMAQVINSIGTLIGPPISAALADKTSNHGGINYLAMQLFSGFILLLGSGNLVCLRILLIRRRQEGSKLI